MSFGGSFGTMFDYRKLATSLLHNNQWHTPPSDTIRMGIVVGYDPNWQSESESYSHPFLSIQMEGDTGPMHGFRFLESYIPKIGDTVWVVWSGEDAWVLGALAGSNIYDQGSTLNGNNGTIQRKRSPMTLIGHQAFLEITAVAGTGATGVTTVVPPGMTGTYPGATCYRLDATGLETDFLPNRIYRAEATLRFKISGAVPYYSQPATGTGSPGYTAPTGSTGSTISVVATVQQSSGSTSTNLSVTNASVNVPVTVGGIGVAGSTTDPWDTVAVYGRVFYSTDQTKYVTYNGATYQISQIVQDVSGDTNGINAFLAYSGGCMVAGYGFPASTQVAVNTVLFSTGSLTYHNISTLNPPLLFVTDQWAGNQASGGSAAPYPNPANNDNFPAATGPGFQITLTNIGESSGTFNASGSSDLVTVTAPYVKSTIPIVTPTIKSNPDKSLVSIGVLTPTNTYQPQAHYEEMQLLDVTGTPDGTYFTIHCSTTFWVTPTKQIVGGSWVGLNTTGPTNEWYLAVIPNGTSGSVPTVTFTAASNPNNDPSLQLDDTQRFVIYDCGVAQ
jgi:hypothetical protein